MNINVFLQTLASGILIGAMYGLIGLGIGLLLGVMKFLNVAHGTFVVLGGYVCYWLFTLLGIDPYLSLPVVIAVMFLVGLVLYKLTLSPLLKLPDIGERINSSMLITFGVVYVLDNVMTLVWKPDIRSVFTSYTGQSLSIGGVSFSITGLSGVAIAILVAIVLYFLLGRTDFGRNIRAATQDAEAAGLSGINVHKTYLISSGIAIALSGVAGVVVVSSYSIAPNGGLSLLLTAFVVMILAGEGNINAIIPAGITLGLLEAIGVFIIGPPYRKAVALIIFFLILMFRPQGLFSRKRDRAG